MVYSHLQLCSICSRQNPHCRLPVQRDRTRSPPCYDREPKDLPIPLTHANLGVENMQSRSLLDAQPLLGILRGFGTQVPASLAANMSIIQQDSLHLPGIVTALSVFEDNDYLISKQGQNLPGVDFYVEVLKNAFTIALPGSIGYEANGDYSGMAGLALYSKWQKLSTIPGGAAAIIDLFWTDIAANSLAGTKGCGLNKSPTPPDSELSRKTKRGSTNGDTVIRNNCYRRHLRYRILYAIPAIVSLGLGLAILVTWLVLLVLGRAGPSKVRWLLDATSPGRMMSVHSLARACKCQGNKGLGKDSRHLGCRSFSSS